MAVDPRVLTALPIAAARMQGTKRGVVSDPLAEKLLAGQTQLLQGVNTGYMAVRMKLGDELCLSQHKNGTTQVVSLGAGMDSRAFRLNLPGTRFFEVDMQALFELKQPLVADTPLRVESRHKVVGVIGEMDIGAALKAQGFDPSKPTTWLMEGLLPYLTVSATHNMAADVGALSAPGSALWGDGFSKTSVDRGMDFHGVPFESGFDDYDVMFRKVGFDDSKAYNMDGVNLDRHSGSVNVNPRYVVTPERARGREMCVMVRAFKTR